MPFGKPTSTRSAGPCFSSFGPGAKDGWHAGGFISGIDLRREYRAHVQLLAYAGLSRGGRVVATAFPGPAAWDCFRACAGLPGTVYSGCLPGSPSRPSNTA